MYEFLANIIMILHFILICGVLIGILVSIRYKRFRPIESIILLSAIIIWSLYDGCPLTYLENFLRIKAGLPIELLHAGFIPFYIKNIFGWTISKYELTITTYIVAFVFFLLSVDFINPYINFEIVKLRKYLKIK